MPTKWTYVPRGDTFHSKGKWEKVGMMGLGRLKLNLLPAIGRRKEPILKYNKMNGLHFHGIILVHRH